VKEGWVTKKLGEICEIERGGSPRPIQDFITTDPKGINWIKIRDATASDKYIYKTEEKIKPDGVKRSRMVYEGDFILSNSMSFGRPYIMKTTGCIHDGWLVLHQPKLDPGYLYHVLSSDLVFSQFDRLAAGSTVRNLNIGLAKSVEIPFPPLGEQKRIVRKLDEAFEGIAKAKSNAEKNLQNARSLFESRLETVFTQRGDEWQRKPLGELCERITKGSSPKWQGIDYVERPGVLFVTSENVGEFEILMREPKYVEEKFNIKDKKSILKCGDVLTNIVGASIGRTAVFNLEQTANINQAVCLIRCQPNLLYNAYLAYLLNSPVFKQVLHDNEVNTARANLSLTFFSELPVPSPSLAVQRQVVGELDQFRKEVQHLESLYQQKLAALEELKKSLLHQAFTGGL
jgi:type I restriction enzyme S subunit